MEQTNRPFRLRLNLFDLLVLAVILAAGLFTLWTMFRPEPEAENADWVTVRYSIHINQVLEGTSELIQPGDPLEYTLEPAQLGTVVSIEPGPCLTYWVDEETLTTRQSVVPGYESIDLVVDAQCQEEDYCLRAGGTIVLRAGGLLYIRGPQFAAVGTITDIERGDAA